MEFTGIITFKSQETVVGQNATPKMNLVLEEAEEKQYNNSISIDFLGDEKVEMARAVRVGDVVTVKYNIKATEYQGKHYTNINGWGIRTVKEKQLVDGGNFDKETKPTKPTTKGIVEENFDDLPF